jgi:hypothetical protein
MAINVNTVYNTVLTILNKEQRGYLTPYEFNKVANQVQLEIFENYFEDYNQFLRMPKTDEEFASRVAHIEEEIQVFEEYKSASSHAGGVYDFPQDSNNKNEVYRLGSIYFNAVPGTPQIELVGRKEYKQQLMSPLTQPSKSFPIGILKNDKVEVYPKVTTFNPVRATSIDDVKFSYIKKPSSPRWGYQVGSLGQFTYDPTVFQPDLLNSNGGLVQNISPNFTTATSQAPIIVTPGTTTGITITTLNPAATGLTLTFSITNGQIDQLQIKNPGKGYSNGDAISFNGANFGQSGTIAVCTLSASSFNSGSTFGSTDFEISESMQPEVVLEILKYSGVIIRDPQIVQVAQQELLQEEANEKR